MGNASVHARSRKDSVPSPTIYKSGDMSIAAEAEPPLETAEPCTFNQEECSDFHNYLPVELQMYAC